MQEGKGGPKPPVSKRRATRPPDGVGTLVKTLDTSREFRCGRTLLGRNSGHGPIYAFWFWNSRLSSCWDEMP